MEAVVAVIGVLSWGWLLTKHWKYGPVEALVLAFFGGLHLLTTALVAVNEIAIIEGGRHTDPRIVVTALGLFATGLILGLALLHVRHRRAVRGYDRRIIAGYTSSSSHPSVLS
ncbi:hypothetical protein [Ruania halotolerans]|uniref:hypothetical protein n=1 Tax=Ruania halotolerans TaxID=2897773 RepID=UPI001E2BD507|nr:hypothetical protein [Ruania halotolerans]UFU07582.1 hypothetical protein LQF10_05630 [Ruania halotolerans]